MIVNTSSSSGVLYDREMIAYTTTKTRGHRHDPADGGRLCEIRCQGERSLPRLGRHALQRTLHRPDGRARAIEAYIRERVPLGRWASVDEIAESILFLVSDRSSYMTGQILVCGRGETGLIAESSLDGLAADLIRLAKLTFAQLPPEALESVLQLERRARRWGFRDNARGSWRK